MTFITVSVFASVCIVAALFFALGAVQQQEAAALKELASGGVVHARRGSVVQRPHKVLRAMVNKSTRMIMRMHCVSFKKDPSGK